MHVAGVARWQNGGQIIGLKMVPGGLGIFFSSDFINFQPLEEPLLPIEEGSWNRPAPGELLTYFSILDAGTGSNNLGNNWLLAYMYIRPHEGFGKRYLVLRPVTVTMNHDSAQPQVGVMLARWYNDALHDRWCTTEAVPGSFRSYKLEAKLGFVLTKVDPRSDCLELTEYLKDQPGQNRDHLVAERDSLESHGYAAMRPLGWIYAQKQPNTQPLYQCFSNQYNSHFLSNSPDADGNGLVEKLLGYTLIK